MIDQQIRTAVLASPMLRTNCELGNDQAIADAVSLTVANTEKLTRERLRKIFGFERSSQMIFRAKSVANGVETEEQYRMSLLVDLLLGEGIDLWADDAQSIVGFLVAQQVITLPEVAQVLALKQHTTKPSLEQVGLALSPWRPEGKIGPIPQDATAEIE